MDAGTVELLSTNKPEAKQPKILDMKIWEISGKPVFYGFEGSDSLYNKCDCEWQKSPTYLDYFNKREISPTDLGEVLVHGLMDDADYSILNESGLIDPTLSRMHSVVQGLKQKIDALEKTAGDQAAPAPSLDTHTSGEAEMNEANGGEPVTSDSLLPGLTGDVSGDFNTAVGLLKESNYSGTVLDQIFAGVLGLSECEKKILKLVASNPSPVQDQVLGERAVVV